MTIYILTEPSTGRRLLYTSITAFLEDTANPIFVQPRQWSNLCRDGYPVNYRGWMVEKEQATTTAEVRGMKLQFL
jgi:hypothetical protein